jgi:hypothetical protein
MDKPTQPDTTPGLEIMKVGTHVAEDGREFTFTEAELKAIADNYDPQVFEAPIVVGHPKTDDPAYGWANTLRVKDGSLFAEPHQVEPQFAEMVNAGRYKKISPSIYLPDTPGNPTPGKLYLKHIGFLGGAAPSVKGMRAASFNEGDGEGAPAASFSMPLTGLGWALTDLFQRFRDWLIDRDGLEVANQVIPQWQIRSIDEQTREKPNPLSYAAPPAAGSTPETTMSQQQNAADFAEREKAINDKTTALEQREKALKDREAKAAQEEAAAFAEQLVQDGKLLPREKDGVVALMLALPAGTALNFAEGDTQVSKPAGEFLRGFLGALPKRIDYTEKSRDDGTTVTGAASFAAPRDATVDASRLALHKKALAYQAAHPGTEYLAAVEAVGG